MLAQRSRVAIFGCSVILCLGCDRPPEVPVRPVKMAEVDAMGDISPDGRYLTYVDWSTGDLALRDLGSGEDRHLTAKGSWLESSEWAEYSLISPDGASVAYAWRREDGVYDLRLLEIDGSALRLLGPGRHQCASGIDRTDDSLLSPHPSPLPEERDFYSQARSLSSGTWAGC